MPAADRELRTASVRGLSFLVVALALLIFVPAWSVTYWQGWLYWLMFAAVTIGITVFLLRYDPELVRRRLKAGTAAEALPTQKRIQALTSVCFIATIVLPALDHLLGWSHVPAALSVIADLVAAIGFYGVFATLRENTFAGSTIAVAEEQQVIASGPYAIVRHPMYATAGLMILATPIALGSWWGLIPAVLLLAGIVARLLDEERFLAFNLRGYAAYMRQTRYRLLPGLW